MSAADPIKAARAATEHDASAERHEDRAQFLRDLADDEDREALRRRGQAAAVRDLLDPRQEANGA